MSADDNNKPNVNYGTKVRNDDPTRNAEDFGDDTTGKFVTTGSSQKTSGVIDDVYKDETVVKGGVQDNNPNTTKTYQTDGSEVDDRQYQKDVTQGMSDVSSERANDIGSEEEV